MHFVDAKGILTPHGSARGMNVYRGCSHGCIYCDARSKCYQFDHAFEDIEVKQNAPELLENALRSMRKRCMIGTGAMCDPYIPAEKDLKITRRCLELIDRYEYGAAIQTKSALILRDTELLESINRKTKAVVQMTLTTFDEDLSRVVEPNVCTTKRRIEVLEEFNRHGIPTVVWLTPILPFINDTKENIENILSECVRIGVKGIICYDMGLTLREGDREYYYDALDKSFPGLKKRYIETYGNAYELPSPNDKELMSVFHDVCRKNNIISDPNKCFSYLGEFPEKFEQMTLNL